MSLKENENVQKRLVRHVSWQRVYGRKSTWNNFISSGFETYACHFCCWHYFWVNGCVLRQGFMEPRLSLNFYTSKTDLEFLILQPPPSKSWNVSHTPSCSDGNIVI